MRDTQQNPVFERIVGRFEERLKIELADLDELPQRLSELFLKDSDPTEDELRAALFPED
jgi:hypothetical protein